MQKTTIVHQGNPPKFLAAQEKGLETWSPGFDRAAIAIPPSPEQLELEAKLETARKTYETVQREVVDAERKRVAKEGFMDPDSVGMILIRSGSAAMARIDAAEADVRAIQSRISALERDRDFRMRQWREKH